MRLSRFRSSSRLRRWQALALAGSLILFASGCGTEPRAGEDTYVAQDGEPIGFAAVGDAMPRFGDVPWPSDLYRDADGKVGTVPGIERVAGLPAKLVQGLAVLDGFGRSTGALFFLAAEVDAASLPRSWDEAHADDASAFIVDVDPRSARRGARYPVLAKYLPTLHCISVLPVPGVVLAPGVQYAALITTRARAANGRRLVADQELARIAALPAAARASASERLYGAALDALAATSAVQHKHEVAALAVFTTSRMAHELAALRTRLQQQPQPQLILDAGAAAPYTVALFGTAVRPSLDEWLGQPEKDEHGREWPGGDNPGGIAHDAIGAVASGVFVAPSFLDRATHHFEREAGSQQIALADATLRIPVTLVVPKQAPPPDGYPVVVHGHGLSNHRGSMFGVANELARAGYVMIGIDDVLHGARQPIRDEQNIFPGTYEGPDGIPDGVGFPVAFFGAFNDFIALRDNFRQTILDQCSLVRLIRNSTLDLAPLAAAAGLDSIKLDGERIYWSGGSLGGIVGAMTLGVEPQLKAAALQVPGAGFVQFITTNSAQLAPLVFSLSKLTLGVKGDEVLDEFHPVASLVAAITEAGDPLAYAPHIYSEPLLPERLPPDVLITYAVGDEVLPNIATIALIRTLGLGLASPSLVDVPGVAAIASPVLGNLPSGKTGAAVQYLPANHGLGYARHDTRQFLPGIPRQEGDRFPPLPKQFTFEQPIREHLAQLVTFFDSVRPDGAARIEVTAPPRQDFDGDGILDDDERRNGTDPYDPDSH